MHSSHPVPKGGISFRQRYKPIDLATHLSKSLLANPLLKTPYSAYDGPPGNPDFAQHDILLLQATLISYITGTQDASAVAYSSLFQMGLDLPTWQDTLADFIKNPTSSALPNHLPAIRCAICLAHTHPKLLHNGLTPERILPHTTMAAKAHSASLSFFGTFYSAQAKITTTFKPANPYTKTPTSSTPQTPLITPTNPHHASHDQSLIAHNQNNDTSYIPVVTPQSTPSKPPPLNDPTTSL